MIQVGSRESVGEDGEVDRQPLGRREAAKLAQRQRIRRAAMALFLDRGFDAVTTTQVAEAAGVAPATLFNYFAKKEDLFFGQVDELEAALVEVVASCPAGESLMTALRNHVVYELTAGRAYTAPAKVAPFHKQVAQSRQLQDCEADIYQRRELVLAAALTDALDCAQNPMPARIAAALYVAAQRLIAAELRHRLTRQAPRRALEELDPFIDTVFDLIRGGVGDLPAAPVSPSVPR
jgi:AcrR family transcriptional regulator